MPTLPTAAPRWVVDPDFNLDFHVRRMRVPEPGTLREVFDMAEVILQSPLDISRPLWSVTLIEGLADGGAAAAAAPEPRGHRRRRDASRCSPRSTTSSAIPNRRPHAPLPIPQDLSPNDLMRQGHQRSARRDRRRYPRRASPAPSARSARPSASPARRWRDALELRKLGTSGDAPGRRALTAAAPAQPVDPHRGASTCKLSDLHQAAKAAGGSINDAYLAGLCGALRLYHEALGVPDQDAADGGAGQSALRRRSRRRQPVRRSQPRGAGGHRRSGRPDPEDPRADDPAPRRGRHRHARVRSRRCCRCCPTRCWNR